MTAMGYAQFVVRLVQARDGKQERRQWSGLELLRSLAWLKRMNARGQAASRLAAELCRSGSAITVAEFGALVGLTCHAPGMAEGQAARYALLQTSSGTVAAAAAPCLERMAHLPDPPLPPRLSMPHGAVRKRSSGRAR